MTKMWIALCTIFFLHLNPPEILGAASSLWTTTASSTRVLLATSNNEGAAITDESDIGSTEIISTLHSGNNTIIITSSNTTARKGDVVFLPCETPQSMGKQVQVSWVRRKDWHILTSGLQTYTKEERFAVHHPKDSNQWTLSIKYVMLSDAGTYECQIVGGSTSISKLVNLSVVTPRALIPGNGEYHVDAGSTISLVCYIEEINKAPPYIFWYHNTRMINYDTERGGITVQIFTEPKVRSLLTVTNAKLSDSGKYTCAAANTEPASITVYITQVNKIAAVQPRAMDATSAGSSPVNPTSLVIMAVLAIYSAVVSSFSTRLLSLLTRKAQLQHHLLNSVSLAAAEVYLDTKISSTLRFEPD